MSWEYTTSESELILLQLSRASKLTPRSSFSFGLPEATVGLYAAAGGLPRIVRNCGLQIGSEIAMTGRRLTAQEALDFHLINKVSKTPESVIEETVEVAKKIASLSPDAIIVTRHGLRYFLHFRSKIPKSGSFGSQQFSGHEIMYDLCLEIARLLDHYLDTLNFEKQLANPEILNREAWETASVERAAQKTSERYDQLLFEGPNMKIGLEAFASKKKPQWVPSKI